MTKKLKKDNILQINLSNLSDNRKTRKNKIHSDSFFYCMKPIIRLAQCFGHFSILCGLDGGVEKMRLQKYNMKYVLTVYLLLGNTLFALTLAPGLLHNPLDNFQSSFFYTICIVITIFLMRLSSQWPIICTDFSRMESVFQHYGYPQYMTLKIKTIMSIFVFLAAAEHFSIVSSQLYAAARSSDGNIFNTLDAFFLIAYEKQYRFIGYWFWSGFLIFPCNIAITFTWNFLDLFLGFIGMIISERFKQFNERLSRYKSKKTKAEFWHQARYEFNSLSSLTKKLDQTLGNLIILSVVNNVFFICIQLFHTIISYTRTVYDTYYILSFSFLVLRTLFSSFYLAEVNYYSRESMSIIFTIPTSSYCSDSHRLLLQMNNDVIGFTGKHLFLITKGAILTIAGTIISYEVILVQLNTRIDVNAQSMTKRNSSF